MTAFFIYIIKTLHINWIHTFNIMASKLALSGYLHSGTCGHRAPGLVVEQAKVFDKDVDLNVCLTQK